MLKIMLLLSTSLFAQDPWLCTESSSEVRGDSIAACGVGEGESEGLARKMAFENARSEFGYVCTPDTACGARKYTVEPKRASCERKDGVYKCYRLVVYTQVDEPRREIARVGIIPSQSSAKVYLSNQDLIDAALRGALLGR